MTPGLQIRAGKPKQNKTKFHKYFWQARIWKAPTGENLLTWMGVSDDTAQWTTLTSKTRKKGKVAGIQSCYCRREIENGKSATCSHVCETQGDGEEKRILAHMLYPLLDLLSSE